MSADSPSYTQKLRDTIKNPLDQELLLRQKQEDLKIRMESQLLKWFDEQFLMQYLKNYHHIDTSRLSETMKKKFSEEMTLCIKEINSKPLKESIDSLRVIRATMSWGIESGMDDAFYHKMIISNTLRKKIIIIDEAINLIISDKIKVWNIEYKRDEYERFKNGLSNLDKKYWLNVSSTIGEKIVLWKVGSFNLDNALKSCLDDLYYRLHTIASDSNKQSDYDKSKALYNASRGIIEEYRNLHTTFDTQNTRMYTQLFSWFRDAPSGIWLNGGRHEELERAFADKLVDIENMSMADIIIFFSSILPYLSLILWPVAGAAFSWLWWAQDLLQAYSGVNFDGSLQSKSERWANIWTWLLWASLLGWTLYGAIKIAKSAKVISMIDKVIERLQTLVTKVNKISLSVELPKDQKTFDMAPKIIKYLQDFKNPKPSWVK